jgi:Zn-dependent peptidase ImmA (M78 family)
MQRACATAPPIYQHMAKALLVPITPEVLRWAVSESGYSPEEVATRLDVAEGEFARWIAGTALPSLTAFRKLTSLLKRPSATFLLPSPPESKVPAVAFRHPPGVERGSLNPIERRYIREAARIQRTLSWVLGELRDPDPELPEFKTSDDPEGVANWLRRKLEVSDDEHLSWKSASQAFRAWREMVEGLGVGVYQYSLGKESCRGFSMWEKRLPIIAVNTHWNHEARSFSLFHECGHLLTRTSSACLDHRRTKGPATDVIERWCEEFAAGVLLPWPGVEQFMRSALGWKPKQKVRDLDSLGKVARRFRASLSATAIRLIGKEAAEWPLFDSIPKKSDHKSDGGPPGEGRKKWMIVRDELGERTPRLFGRAIESDLIAHSTALDHLDLSYSGFETLQQSLLER